MSLPLAEMKGFNIKVVTPGFTEVRAEGQGSTPGSFKEVVTWANGRNEIVIEVVNSELRVDGKNFGTVEKADSIVIRQGKASVNGTEREPRLTTPP